VARRQLEDTLKERFIRVVDESPFQKAVDRFGIGRAGKSGSQQNLFDLGAKQEPGAHGGKVEGLHTKTVSGAKKPSFFAVPESEAPHAVKALQAVLIPLLLSPQQNFCVAPGVEGIPKRFQLLPDFFVVVDFSVKYDAISAIFDGHRLIA
jgi:hypothetical protein